MIVAQGRDVLLGIASSVTPIAAVIVRLSLGSVGAIAAVMVRLSLVLTCMATNVGAISAVRVRLSLGQGQLQTGLAVNMASSVGFISAVKVKLSLGHGQSSKGHVGVGVSRMGVANITEVALGVGVVISTNTAGPQDAKNNRISPIGNNRKMLGNIFLMFFSS